MNQTQFGNIGARKEQIVSERASHGIRFSKLVKVIMQQLALKLTKLLLRRRQQQPPPLPSATLLLLMIIIIQCAVLFQVVVVVVYVSLKKQLYFSTLLYSSQD